MAQNVRFYSGTKQQYLSMEQHNPLALYFCDDTGELFKGDILLSDGVRIVPTRADLPSFECAAEGVVYYIADTRAGFMIAPTRDAWLQTIYAPVDDVNSIPEGEEYNVVTTVGAVRDIERAIYDYIDNIEISGAHGKDGVGIEKIEKISSNANVDTYQIVYTNQSVSTFDVVNGVNGQDGLTPHITDGYWYIGSTNTGVKAVGTDGKNGIDGKNGLDGKDGANGKDGVDGKEGASAYDVWLNAGHSGTEDDFLQWLKGDTDPFEDVVTSIACGGIEAGTSLKGKTVKDVLVMLLGITDPPQSVVEYIISNSIPSYKGTMSVAATEVEYQLLDADTANYTDQGFYTKTNADGDIVGAGYQVTIVGNNEADAQVVCVPSNAVIISAYRYDIGGTNSWLPYTFDLEDEANYWILGDTITQTINGEEVTYQTYLYNIDVVGGGDAITNTQYWRFEIEVVN